MRMHGAMLGSGWRYMAQWNMDRIREMGTEKLKKEVEILRNLKTRYERTQRRNHQ